MSDFLVRRDDPRTTRIVESPPPEPEEGQARLRVDLVGLTANNVTYALLGDAMSYWDFFPAEDGWGRVPMWGFAEVEESRAEGVADGTRLYGYLPPSTHFLVTPAAVEEAGFIDGSPHRAELPSAYQRYLATDRDRFHRPGTDPIEALLRPLFFTSFLLDDQLADDGLVERGRVIISSASSKTSIAAAHMLARREGSETVALTSAANVPFVESLGVYAEVVPYEEIGSLERRPSTFVDVAGNAGLRRAVHEHLGGELVASIAVGMSHWEAGGLASLGEELPGPRPTFFFAPDRVRKRGADWGRDGLEERVASAWAGFCDWVGGWLEVVEGSGLEDLQAGFLELIDGGPGPSRARVVRLD